VFRQQNDSVFLNILNDLRRGVVTKEAQRVLCQKVQVSYQAARAASAAEASQASKIRSPDISLVDTPVTQITQPVVRPTKLFSTNKDEM
ncbi:hypothetical protein B484DRAFT_411628, partial [Ochromonadaceae sp. CCMP2298]